MFPPSCSPILFWKLLVMRKLSETIIRGASNFLLLLRGNPCIYCTLIVDVCLLLLLQSFRQVCGDSVWWERENLRGCHQNIFAGKISCLSTIRSWEELSLLLHALCCTTGGNKSSSYWNRSKRMCIYIKNPLSLLNTKLDLFYGDLFQNYKLWLCHAFINFVVVVHSWLLQSALLIIWAIYWSAKMIVNVHFALAVCLVDRYISLFLWLFS